MMKSRVRVNISKGKKENSGIRLDEQDEWALRKMKTIGKGGILRQSLKNAAKNIVTWMKANSIIFLWIVKVVNEWKRCAIDAVEWSSLSSHSSGNSQSSILFGIFHSLFYFSYPLLLPRRSSLHLLISSSQSSLALYFFYRNIILYSSYFYPFSSQKSSFNFSTSASSRTHCSSSVIIRIHNLVEREREREQGHLRESEKNKSCITSVFRAWVWKSPNASAPWTSI